jgi:hypothetical protein
MSLGWTRKVGRICHFVLSGNLGYTATFQHAAGKTTKQVDASRDWTFEPPVPLPDAYWTLSITDDADESLKHHLWQLTITLPSNTIYVMSGPLATIGSTESMSTTETILYQDMTRRTPCCLLLGMLQNVAEL